MPFAQQTMRFANHAMLFVKEKKMSNCVKSGKKGCSSFALYVAVIHILLKKGRLKKAVFIVLYFFLVFSIPALRYSNAGG
jgi:hypothetical protein